ncbi:hypothetical protein M0Q97_11640 [Candidatus Dojkabacteria bacterium]|jgi:hypothetical protein|nr:hypothetical protein [Candidatus Dojkabacteria bacterium]
MGLNSAKNQRNFRFQPHKVETKTKQQIITEKLINSKRQPGDVKLKGVWFTKQQNSVVASMLILSMIIGLIVGLIIGLIIG